MMERKSGILLELELQRTGIGQSLETAARGEGKDKKKAVQFQGLL